eukprot:7838434-Prorocentrum_lima.AAC.1
MKWASAPMELALSASSNPFGEEAFKFEAAPAEAILAQPVQPEVSPGFVGEDANSDVTSAGWWEAIAKRRL